MKVVSTHKFVFQNGERYLAVVNLGLVSSNSSDNASILDSITERTQTVYFLNVVRKPFNSEQEATKFVDNYEADLTEKLKNDEFRSALEKDLSEKVQLVTITSTQPIRTANQKRFGIPAQRNEFAGRYTIRRAYRKDQVELADYLKSLFGSFPENHEIQDRGEQIIITVHEPINVEEASAVIDDITQIVEEQEL